MLILGLSGGIDPIFETRFGTPDSFHDSAAVLLRDGAVVAGIEEERLNRIKHTNKIWSAGLKFCLESAGLELEDIDYFGFYADEAVSRAHLRNFRLSNPQFGIPEEPRELLRQVFLRDFGRSPRLEQLKFVHHHAAHAFSAYAMSGFDSSLVLTIDGIGDHVATGVFDADENELTWLASKPIEASLGHFYFHVVRRLGYNSFDEYKIMGLAPYGDRRRFQALFSTFYSLLPNGDYAIHFDRMTELYSVLSPRRKDEPFKQDHHDAAAAVQDSLETIVFHILKHYRHSTGRRRLCLSGGVAQNSSLNGRILASGLFDDVFVSPAAYDGGCSLGAALAIDSELNARNRRERVQHVYWGTDIGSQESIRQTLERWSAFLSFHELENCTADAARLLSEGKVIGWVQGRSEFGPRALGNRSILADPRPAAHKEIINAMIKKREAYRPFAPSVLEEEADKFFVLPGTQRVFPFMSFVLPVREEMRSVLGAITHVDGTARIQTVNQEHNPKYWQLLSEFGRITGIPILLNTSFNNNAEPIVDTVEDAVVCYLTSGLHYLVAGDFLVEKKPFAEESLLMLAASFSKAVSLVKQDRYVDYERRRAVCTIAWNSDPARVREVSPEVYELLHVANPETEIGDLLAAQGLAPEARSAIASELFQLWSERHIILRPVSASLPA
jgi:carbamoyltransferase